MKTLIFENIQAFLNREDKKINGVLKEFAELNPNWDEERGNEGCWNCSGCSDCFRCSDCSGCFRCSDCYDCYGCSDCFRCFRCSDCSGCSGCSDCFRCYGCSGCFRCYGLAAQKLETPIPVIPQIHNAVRQAVEAAPQALDMGDWHTCETTHCRAGWVVYLAGDAGKELEAKTSTEFAAKQIYKASSPIKVSPIRFFDTDEKAMADIIRCAEEETALLSNQ